MSKKKNKSFGTLKAVKDYFNLKEEYISPPTLRAPDPHFPNYSEIVDLELPGLLLTIAQHDHHREVVGFSVEAFTPGKPRTLPNRLHRPPSADTLSKVFYYLAEEMNNQVRRSLNIRNYIPGESTQITIDTAGEFILHCLCHDFDGKEILHFPRDQAAIFLESLKLTHVKKDGVFVEVSEETAVRSLFDEWHFLASVRNFATGLHADIPVMESHYGKASVKICRSL